MVLLIPAPISLSAMKNYEQRITNFLCPTQTHQKYNGQDGAQRVNGSEKKEEIVHGAQGT